MVKIGGIVNFEDIRPYNDVEYHQVINRLLAEDVFIKAIQVYYPELSFKEIKEKLLSFDLINDFQSEFVCNLIGRIIGHSVQKISFKGRESLINDKSYLYISNHRDIVLDSAFLNFGFNQVGLNISEIAIGSNLLTESWIEDLVRLNKSFIVKRNIPKQESLGASKTLSAYLHHTLKEKKKSIWIAQREGRAKDGFDKTNPGLLKMFGLSSTDQVLDSLISMNIRPVSISYEYDPCDHLKIPELIAKTKNEEYTKSDNEDNQHILIGVRGNKGNVNFTIGEGVNEKLEKLSFIKNRNELLKKVAFIIDEAIYKNYHLWNSNYVAYDLLNVSNKYVNKYDPDGKEKFINYLKEKLVDFSGNKLAEELFLKMYANPVINFEQISSR